MLPGLYYKELTTILNLNLTGIPPLLIQSGFERHAVSTHKIALHYIETISSRYKKEVTEATARSEGLKYSILGGSH